MKLARAISAAWTRFLTRGLAERLAREKAFERSPSGRLVRGLHAQNAMTLPKWSNRRAR